LDRAARATVSPIGNAIRHAARAAVGRCPNVWTDRAVYCLANLLEAQRATNGTTLTLPQRPPRRDAVENKKNFAASGRTTVSRSTCCGDYERTGGW
jgi:hypothetical protein